MISKYTYKNLTWVDLESPSREEIIHLIEEYNIPELVGEELVPPNVRSRVDLYENCIYFVLRFPHIDSHKKKDTEQEIDFVIGKDFLITTHYEHVHGLLDFAKLFETNSVLDKGQLGNHAGLLFYHLMKTLYRYAEDELEHIHHEVKEIELNIFAKREERMVGTISHVSRKLLDFKQAFRFHNHLLESFENSAPKLFGPEYLYHARAISAEYHKLQSTVDSYKEMLNDLRTTNDSLLATKSNKTMMHLMMMSFVVFPLSLIAGIFGMNTQQTPIIGHASDFWIIVGIMTGATLLMLVYFKHKKWL